MSNPRYTKKPIVSWFKSGDPCSETVWLENLSDINVIETKRLTDDFVAICLREKNRFFLHVKITGMGQTVFEPNIPTVKQTFFQLKKLIDGGFPQKQILVCVDPILPNENGLKALKLLLRLFTEFNTLRLRFIKFKLLGYHKLDNGKYVIANRNVNSRPEINKVMSYLTRSATFYPEYYKLIASYNTICSVDKGDVPIIGIRELIVFGLKNEWIDSDNNRTKIINYEKNNKYKPNVNIISNRRPKRCQNNCILCAHT